MSNHYTYTYFIPYKAKALHTSPLYRFDCHYGSRVLTVRAEYPHIARQKAAAYFGTSPSAILARRV
jgi:hypothetical protein